MSKDEQQKLKLVFVPVDTCTDPASTDSKPLSV